MASEGQRPRPEDFGLSPEAAARLPGLFVKPRRNLVCAVFLLAALAANIVCMTWTTGSPAAGLFLGPVFAIASLILLLPLTVGLVYLAGSLEERCRSAVDPDFRACRMFQRALEAFESETEAQRGGGRQGMWRVADLPRLQMLASASLGAGAPIEKLDRTDTGADLLVRKEGGTLIVRCEAGADPVDVAAARELAMARLDLDADEGVLVAPAGGTPKLLAYIENRPLRLLDAAALQALDTPPG